MSQQKIVFRICLVLFLFLSSNVFAGEADFEVKEGAYLGLSWVYNNIDGDFDDSTFYASSTHVYNVPDVDGGMGFGISLGYRSKIGALEFGYQRTNHDTHTIITDMNDQDADYNIVEINFKFDVFAKGKFRPNILIGIGFPWLNIKNNKTDGITLSDEKFTGIAGNLGAGIAYYFNPQWCVNGTIMYRWQSFNKIDGLDVDDNVTGGGFNYTVGIAYTF